MNKDIEQYNAKGEEHGYWESYHSNGQLWYKCVYYNGKENGVEEQYWNEDGKLTDKTYHL